jgi:hypothetical protein
LLKKRWFAVATHPQPSSLLCWLLIKISDVAQKPLPIRFQSSIGTNITYKTSDGKDASAYFYESKKAYQ